MFNGWFCLFFVDTFPIQSCSKTEQFSVGNNEKLNEDVLTYLIDQVSSLSADSRLSSKITSSPLCSSVSGSGPNFETIKDACKDAEILLQTVGGHAT